MTAKFLKVNPFDLLRGRKQKPHKMIFKVSLTYLPSTHFKISASFLIPQLCLNSTSLELVLSTRLAPQLPLASFTSSRTPAVESALSKINGPIPVPLLLKHYLKAQVEHHFSYTQIFEHSLTTEQTTTFYLKVERLWRTRRVLFE